MKIFEARALTEQEILAKKRELKAEYLNLQLQRTTGQVEKPSRFRDIRRAIARLETALTEKRRAKTNAQNTAKN
jgi:large subunit ribosomal protein L29